jgi:hypothetical protein
MVSIWFLLIIYCTINIVARCTHCGYFWRWDGIAATDFAWVFHNADCENLIDTNEFTVDVSEYSCLRFDVDLRRNSSYSTTPETSITVKVGENWYASKTIWTSTSTSFSTKTLFYDPNKNNWDTLDRATAARGSTASSDLSGDITEFG